MQQATDELRESVLKLREHLSALERDWLGACLVSSVGVKRAIYSDKYPDRLVVEYDANLMNGTDLLDILYLRGVRAELRAADLVSARTKPSVSPC